jgi:hypothetical protein
VVVFLVETAPRRRMLAGRESDPVCAASTTDL